MDNANDLDLDSLMELLDNEPLTDETEIIVGINSKVIPVSKKDLVKKCTPYLQDIPLDLSPKKGVTLKKENMSSSSVFIKEESLIHTGDTDIWQNENKQFLTEDGKEIEKKIALPSKYSLQVPNHKKTPTWKSAVTNRGGNHIEANKFHTEYYSGIRIVNPAISFDMMQQRMKDRRMIKMSFIKAFIKRGDIEGDWVTMGVLVNKLPPKTSKNGKTFSIWKMTDLQDCEKIVTMFLFGTAHAEHWKTAVGTVIGFLNPSIMPEKDKNNTEITLSIDHGGKLMCMGKSKDFGHCKGKKKDNTSCTSVVNLSQCEYCIYHVKKEYQKFSAKRSELQASYSGREPSLKDKILKKQNVFYGGQMFIPSEKNKKTSRQNSKDQLTLLNLGLKRKAEAIESEEKNKGVKKLAELYGPEIIKTAENNSEFINNQLVVPNAGSRNLLQHMMKEKSKKEENIKVITPKELLKMRNSSQQNKTNQKQIDNAILQGLTPKLGKGLEPGQIVSLEFSSYKNRNAYTPQALSKLKAIKKIKDKGPLKRQDPNSVKASSDITSKVQAVLNSSMTQNQEYTEDEIIDIPKSKLGVLDMKSEKIKEILNRKSSHAYEVESEELEKQETYFNALEKKERMEEKMTSTTEIVCDVISCKECKYTAHQATDRCKEEGHPLKRHKAIKRFFVCKDCKRRTCCFTKLPKRSCRTCGGSNYERTSMMKPRSGPKLDSEILKIRGDEIKFLNSLK